jgi:very-short-patch-repair endonuclease
MMAARDLNEFTPPGRFAATLPIEGREGVKPASPVYSKQLAKRLRQNMTGPEAKLWRNLRRIKTIDTHFRKQFRIGPYVVDFACLRSKLIIEVDGEQHGFDRGLRHDAKRSLFLESSGFSVLRFWNHEVLQETGAVLDTIYSALHGSPDARPVSASKRRGGDERTPSSPSMGEVVRRSRTGGGGKSGSLASTPPGRFLAVLPIRGRERQSPADSEN